MSIGNCQAAHLMKPPIPQGYTAVTEEKFTNYGAQVRYHWVESSPIHSECTTTDLVLKRIDEQSTLGYVTKSTEVGRICYHPTGKLCYWITDLLPKEEESISQH